MDGELSPVRRVDVAFTKWDGSPHWEFSMTVLGDDDHGTWLWAPQGTVLRRGAEPPLLAESDFVELVRPDGWWTALWNARSRFEVYVDIATPARWDGDRVTMVDLDLDVVRLVDGTVALLDEDEFADHAEAMDYPPRLLDVARTTAAAVHRALAERREPFGAVGRTWLERGSGTL